MTARSPLSLTSRSGSALTVVFAVLAMLALFAVVGVLYLQYTEYTFYEQQPSAWVKPGMGAPPTRSIVPEPAPAPAPAATPEASSNTGEGGQ